MPMIADKLISLLYEWDLTFPRCSDEKTQAPTEPVFFEQSKISSDVVDLIGIEPTTLRMRTVRSPAGERNMPLK